MTELNWTNKYELPFNGHVQNDSFRRAFDAIARKAVPFFDAEYAYYSDLMWDAQHAVLVMTGDAPDHFYIAVRDVGTNIHMSLKDARENHGIKPRAVLKVEEYRDEYGNKHGLSVQVLLDLTKTEGGA